MIDLNDKKAILDTQGGNTVLNSVNALPQQLKQSFSEALKITIPNEYRNVKNIVVCGMGGSQWPAYIIKELFKNEIKVPYIINSDYTLPGYTNEETLVILSSYSGTTEESVFAGKAAFSKKAKIIGITSGGEIDSFLKENKFPVYVFHPEFNPSKQPRIGFGYGVGGHLGLLVNLGLIDLNKNSVFPDLDKMPDLIKEFGIDQPVEKNPAKRLAQNLYQKYPYYIVAEFLIGLGNAIQNQTNETAKSISSFRIIPELNHHMMEGLKFPDKHREIAVFVFFNSNFYSSPIKKRFEITKDVVEQNKIKTLWLNLKGGTKLEQALYLMALGSYMSMYLAALYGQDPSAIPFVDYFKKRLKES